MLAALMDRGAGRPLGSGSGPLLLMLLLGAAEARAGAGCEKPELAAFCEEGAAAATAAVAAEDEDLAEDAVLDVPAALFGPAAPEPKDDTPGRLPRRFMSSKQALKLALRQLFTGSSASCTPLMIASWPTRCTTASAIPFRPASSLSSA
jgi:hypothetical protein